MAQRRRFLVSAALVPVLGLAGCASRVAGDQVGSPEETMTVDATPGPSTLDCGAAFTPPTATGLSVTGRFPDVVPAGQASVAGTVDVVSAAGVAGVAGPTAEAFLVRDGLVVTVPLPGDSVGVRWDLPAGQVRQLPAEASLLACGPTGGPLPPGSYQVYARVVVTPDDGPGLESYGGPWPLAVS